MAKKKAAKKVAKKKLLANPLATTDVDMDNLWSLALWALDTNHTAFRVDAAKKGNFRTALTAEMVKPGAEGFADMSPEDMAYCEGWLSLLRMELETKEIPDEVLVAKVKKRLASPDDLTLSS